MPQKALSSLELTSFFRFCYTAIGDSISLETWTAFQKFLFYLEQPELASFVKEFKKLPSNQITAFRDGFSAGQTESKLWLIQVVQDVLPPLQFKFFIFGSWFGLLPRMLIWLCPEKVDFIHAIDIDPTCHRPCELLNQPESWNGKIQTQTKDMLEFDYNALPGQGSVVVNTSCEHLTDFSSWYHKIPHGLLVVLQGNDYADHEQHHSTWKDIAHFRQSTPLTTVLFEGVLPLQKYKRFMRIGVR